MPPLFTLTEEELVNRLLARIADVRCQMIREHREHTPIWGTTSVSREWIQEHHDLLTELVKRLSPVSQR